MCRICGAVEIIHGMVQHGKALNLSHLRPNTWTRVNDGWVCPEHHVIAIDRNIAGRESEIAGVLAADGDIAKPASGFWWIVLPECAG